MPVFLRKNFPYIGAAKRRKLRSVMRMNKKNDSSASSKSKRTHIDPVSLARSFRETRDDKIRSDVEGSYTGVARDGGTPIQDVDDL